MEKEICFYLQDTEGIQSNFSTSSALDRDTTTDEVLQRSAA